MVSILCPVKSVFEYIILYRSNDHAVQKWCRYKTRLNISSVCVLYCSRFLVEIRVLFSTVNTVSDNITINKQSLS